MIGLLAEAFDGGEDIVGGSGPSEGLRIGIVTIDDAADIVLALGCGSVDAAPDLLAGKFPIRTRPTQDLRAAGGRVPGASYRTHFGRKGIGKATRAGPAVPWGGQIVRSGFSAISAEAVCRQPEPIVMLSHAECTCLRRVHLPPTGPQELRYRRD